MIELLRHGISTFRENWIAPFRETKMQKEWTIEGRDGKPVRMKLTPDADCPICGQPGVYCSGGKCPFEP